MNETESSTTPKYPVEVQLTGNDSNAFAVMGEVSGALAHYLRENTDLTANEIQAEQDAYRTESMSGDYDNLLRTAMRWVIVL